MHTLEGWSLRPAQSALRMTFVSTLIPMGELRIPATLAPLSSQRGVVHTGFPSQVQAEPGWLGWFLVAGDQVYILGKPGFRAGLSWVSWQIFG